MREACEVTKMMRTMAMTMKVQEESGEGDNVLSARLQPDASRKDGRP